MWPLLKPSEISCSFWLHSDYFLFTINLLSIDPCGSKLRSRSEGLDIYQGHDTWHDISLSIRCHKGILDWHGKEWNANVHFNIHRLPSLTFGIFIHIQIWIRSLGGRYCRLNNLLVRLHAVDSIRKFLERY